MKKIFMLFAALCAMGTVMAQTPTIVSTEPQNRNAIIEELTGIYCQWCPAGHKVVNEIIEANSGHVVGINVHAGYFSQGSPYNTTYGEAYDTQADPDGYPAGTVNRHVFSGNSTVLDRGDFAGACSAIMAMASPVNVAAVGRINEAARQVELHIEIYYTANSTLDSNYLNIAVLQNNVLGQQSGGEANYPEMMENGQYRHMHMLRDMLTGTWGEAIPATQGTFIDTTIVYDVPQAIGQVAIPDLNDLDFVIFVAEGHQEIITGVKAMIISEVPSINFKVYQTGDCSLSYQPYVMVYNTTENDLSNFTFNYNGTTVTSNKTIASFMTDTINMPIYTIEVSGQPQQNCATTKTVSLVSCQKEDGSTLTVNSAEKSVTFAEFDIYSAAGPFNLRVGVDHYGSEASLQFVKQSSCTASWTMGPWSKLPGDPQSLSQIQPARYFENTFNPAAGLYILRVLDGYGDGWRYATEDQPAGFWLSNASGEIASTVGYVGSDSYFYGDAFTQIDIYLNVTSNGDDSYQVGIDDVAAAVEFGIYPNPATDRLNISCNEAVREVSIIDMTGRTVVNTRAEQNINVSGLAAGVYMVRVATENGIGIQKFVKE